MEENTESKLDFKNRIIIFYNNNKFKIYFLFILIFALLLTITIVNINKEKQNILTAEKYVQAGLYLSSNKKDEASKILEEIILSKNNFYSILSLNIIIEKNLITDKNKILEYFNIIEKLSITNNAKDLIIYKKALYLIKISKKNEGIKLLKTLVKKKSNLKILAEEVLKN